MTGPGGAPGEGERDDARTPEQPAWSPPWEPPPSPPAADYPPDYPPLYPPAYPPTQFGPPPPGGYYPPPNYLGGWGPAQPVPRPGTNGLAIASLITAFGGFLCCIGSIVAIVLGTIALDQIKRTREEGYGLAVAGIVLGVAGLVVALIIWIFAMRLP
jgi:Domain of unknown function (DUF4190)